MNHDTTIHDSSRRSSNNQKKNMQLNWYLASSILNIVKANKRHPMLLKRSRINEPTLTLTTPSIAALQIKLSEARPSTTSNEREYKDILSHY